MKWSLFGPFSKTVLVEISKINPNIYLGVWHLVENFKSDPFPFTEVIIKKSEKILVSDLFVDPYSYLA